MSIYSSIIVGVNIWRTINYNTKMKNLIWMIVVVDMVLNHMWVYGFMLNFVDETQHG